MAFCKSCGTQLQGDEHFCPGCGADVSAKAAATPAASTPVPAAAPPQAPPPQAPRPQAPPPQYPPPQYPPQPQGMGMAQGVYGPPGTIPYAVAVPPPPAKKSGTMWTVIIIVALVAGGYYYSHHPVPTPTPTPAPAPGPNPPPPPSSALLSQEAFDAHWQTVNGYIQISNGKWTNNSNVAVQSSTLECDQYDAGGSDLVQMKTTLNGPVQAGAYATFTPFQMGAVTVNLNRVTCTITGVTLAP